MPQDTDKKVNIDKFVFVVTYGRSGSTLVQSLLNTLPGACIRGENGHALMPLARAWRGVNTAQNLTSMRRARVNSTPENPWFGGENIRPWRFGNHLARVFESEVLAPPPGTRIAGFKEIRWTAEPAWFATTLDFAQTFFRNAHFVFNTRDHDQVARSGWWAQQDPDQVVARLQEAEALFDAYQSANPDRCVRVHFNDYTADHDALRPLFTFLNEPFDADAVAQVMARKLTHLKNPD